MTETVKKEAKKVSALTKVYCSSGMVKTSKGVLRHGDYAELPKSEADRLKKDRLVK